MTGSDRGHHHRRVAPRKDLRTEDERPGRRVSVRLSDDLYDGLQRIAGRGRTVATMLRILAEDAVAAATAKKKG